MPEPSQSAYLPSATPWARSANRPSNSSRVCKILIDPAVGVAVGGNPAPLGAITRPALPAFHSRASHSSFQALVRGHRRRTVPVQSSLLECIPLRRDDRLCIRPHQQMPALRCQRRWTNVRFRIAEARTATTAWAQTSCRPFAHLGDAASTRPHTPPRSQSPTRSCLDHNDAVWRAYQVIGSRLSRGRDQAHQAPHFAGTASRVYALDRAPSPQPRRHIPPPGPRVGSSTPLWGARDRKPTSQPCVQRNGRGGSASRPPLQPTSDHERPKTAGPSGCVTKRPRTRDLPPRPCLAALTPSRPGRCADRRAGRGKCRLPAAFVADRGLAGPEPRRALKKNARFGKVVNRVFLHQIRYLSLF